MLRCLLGLHPRVKPYLERMTISDLARLVYRDHITVKHSAKKRLAQEVCDKTPAEQGGPQLSILGSDPCCEQVDALSKMLIQYLLEALVGVRQPWA
jgi:hypothetical protein